MKEGSRDRQSEKGGKTPELASCLRKGRGWRYFLLWHSQTVETSAIFSIECTGVCSPVLLHWIHSSALGQPSYCSLLCAAEGRRKKEEGAEGGKKTCLFVWEGLSRKSDFVIIWVCQQSKALPPDLQQHLVHSACLCCLTPEPHMSVLLKPANSDTRASPDDESRRQSGFHEYWCGG